nr:nuclear pore complex protein NUP107 [Tanacetum cinerariifolium]
SPSGNDEDIFRPHGDPQMIRFGAHLVLVLRHLLADDMKDSFRERLMTLESSLKPATQLARHRCIDLFVHMMELRLNSSVHVRYKIFLSAIEYLPFSPGVDSDGSFEKGSLEEIIERFCIYGYSLQKAMVVQWLCFTPPSTITDAIRVGTKLLLRALSHSNNEYYSCDATYRSWLQIELDNAGVDVSNEEKERANVVAMETLSSSMALLLSEFIHSLLLLISKL